VAVRTNFNRRIESTANPIDAADSQINIHNGRVEKLKREKV
jgi:hypothetical protein